MCKLFIMTFYGMYEPDVVACSTNYGLVFRVKALKLS